MKKFLLGLVISGIFVYLLLRQVDIAEVQQNLANINYFYVALAVIIHMVGFVLRAGRWKYLTNSLSSNNASLGTFFNVSAVGYMLNNLLPLRLGDFTKSLILGKELGVSRSSVLATVFIEKISDGLSLLLIIGVSFLFVPIPESIKNIFVILSFLFVVPVMGVIILAKTKNLFDFSFLNALPFSLKLLPIIKNFWLGLGTGNSVVKNLLILLISIIIWVVEGLMVYFVILSLGLDLSVLASIFITSVTNLGVIIPSAPGYVGPFEFFMTTAASIFGVSFNQAASLAIVTHIAQWLPITLIGIIIILLNQEMINLIRKKEKK